MLDILNTGINNVKNVQRYMFGIGSINSLHALVNERRSGAADIAVYFVDCFFKDSPFLVSTDLSDSNAIIYISTEYEPTTEYIDELVNQINRQYPTNICAVVGIGGGVTLDIAKAVSNLLANGGLARDYQGWDLLDKPGIYKIGVPTISGTGAEATRTCVMTNKTSGLKLGMNSDYTVFDQIIMDPGLTATVPRDQYFWTGMDAYIHCVEALAGSYRNPIGDAFSLTTIDLCRSVFSSSDMQSDKNREKLMVASYLGGCSIATSYVGVVHPFSAGLSVVLGMHHCVANCVAMRAMEEFYPEAYAEFWEFVDRQKVNIPSGVCSGLSSSEFEGLYNATIVHEKPLTNALGVNFKNILSKDKVTELFSKM